MKALILKEYNHFVYGDAPEPSFGPDDILVAVKACGICGSDVHGMDGGSGRRIPPIIMGHEASGITAEVGGNVHDFTPGDRITFDSTIYCGTCRYCRQGLINLCDNRRVLGVSCADYRQHGAFADYVTVPRHIVYRLPELLSFEQTAMVEPCSIAFHAVNRTPVMLNDTAVVIGAGMIGLLVIQALRLAGCGIIVAVDIDRSRLELAGRLGADACVNPDTCDVTGEIMKLTKDRGVDRAIEAVGIPSTVTTAIGCLRKGGSLTLVGNVTPEVELPLQKVVTREITLYGSCASCGEYQACLDMIERGTVNVDCLISAVAPLSEGAVWFKRLYNREPGLMKVILKP